MASCQRRALKHLAHLSGLTHFEKTMGDNSQEGREEGKECLLSTYYVPGPFPHWAIPQDQGWTDFVPRSPWLVCHRPSESIALAEMALRLLQHTVGQRRGDTASTWSTPHPPARPSLQASVICLFKFMRNGWALRQLLGVRGAVSTALSLPHPRPSCGFSAAQNKAHPLQPTRLYTLPALPPAQVSSSADFLHLPVLQAHPASLVHSFVWSFIRSLDG